MISFIIVGRNEGWKLTKSIQSVFDTIQAKALNNYEVIYVDSMSTDDSLSRAKLFPQLKIIQLTGALNSAIARNVGFNASMGDVLFFVDGDMVLNPDFLPLVYNEDQGLKYPFVSGQLKNFNHDRNNKFINNTWQYREVLNGDKYYSTTGGIFLINRKLWESVGGMDNRFKRGQDLEIALRIAAKGTKLLRKKEIIADHYTIAHTHHTRMWKGLLSKDIAYSNSFLLRKHLFNRHIYNRIVKNYYTLLSFIFFTILALLSGCYFLVGGYFLVVMLKTYKVKTNKIIRNIELFVYYIFRDFCFVFFLFVPLKKIRDSEINFIIVK